MILVEMTINSTLYRISNEDKALEHFWDNRIDSMTPIKYTLRGEGGGYVEPSFGTMTLSPKLFTNEWYPPKKCALTIKITDSDEASAVTLFTGNAYRNGVNRDSVKYDFYGDQYTSKLTVDTVIDGNLDDVFTTYCGAFFLNLTLDKTYDRVSIPAVYGVFPAGTKTIDMLSSLAESVNHLFYIEGSTLYLVDMLLDNGTDFDANEFDFGPVPYSDYPLVNEFISRSVKQYSIDGSYPGAGNDYNSDAAKFIEHLFGRAGDNSGDDCGNYYHTTLIPYETGKTYEMRVKVRQTAGATNTFYAGFVGVASDRTTLVNKNGSNAIGLQHYIVKNNYTLSSGWATYSGFASGWSATGIDTASPNVGSPATLQTNVAYVRPQLIANTPVGSAGKLDIDFVAVYEVDGSGNILATLFHDDFTKGFSGEWQNSQAGTGGENRETTTSEASSVTNVEAALGNLKTIIESPRCELPFPLDAANVVRPGQKITWTDESVGPDSNSVTAYIRARNITIDVINHKYRVSGEGAFS